MSAESKLHEIAEAAVNDISRDRGETVGAYEIIVEELRDQWGIRRTYGILFIDDLFANAYVWDGLTWEPSAAEDPYVLRDRVDKWRSYGG